MSSRQMIQSRVEGLEEARAALERIIRAEKGAVRPSLETVGQQWTTEIQKHAPLLTGRLRRSYRWEVGSSAGFTYVEVSSNVEYAPHQEFGTVRITGTPHVRPATETIIRQAPGLISEGLARAAQGQSFGGAAGGAARLGSAIGQLGALGG